MRSDLFKAVLHNVGVVLVALGVGLLGSTADSFLGVPRFAFPLVTAAGATLLALGFVVRLWATVHFYARKMRVISLEPQAALITSGPYAWSRNPLYLGGNVFCFLGAALLFGSPSALVVTALHLPLMDLFIRREEKQLEQRFGDAWRAYRRRVRRWV